MKGGFLVKMKFIFKGKKIVIYSLIAVIILTGGYFTYAKLSKKDDTNKITTAKVELGNIEVSISGSGVIEPNSKYEVTALVKGEVISAPFEEGALVNKGDLLYKIDTKDVENSISKSKLSLERSKNTYNQELENKNKLMVKAPISGTIVNIYSKSGDTIGTNTKMADVIDNSKMVLTVPFVSEHTNGINIGNSAVVALYASSYSLNGRVTKISSGEIISDAGVPIKNVEIIVDNPGTIKKGDKAAAMVGDISCNDVGIFDYNNSATILSEISGKIVNIPYLVGDRISKGSTFATLSSESVSTSFSNQALAIQEAELNLSGQYDQLDNYNITSPISGKVIQKVTKQGDILDNSNSKVVMATIADMSKILFKMNVDELDISKIEIGQKVSVSADALTGKKYTGIIENKSIVGTTSNGVTTYPVTVVVENPEGLIPGMNVNAKVIVEKKDNVVRIPVSALKRGNLVTVKLKDGETAPAKNSKIPDTTPRGFKTIKVKTGLNDKDYIEITEGLLEGDTILIPTAKTTTTTRTTPVPNTGMPGGIPGGMPSGGNTYRSSGGGANRWYSLRIHIRYIMMVIVR